MDFKVELKQLLENGCSGQEIVLYHTEKIDRHIRSLLPDDLNSSPFAIFATGGYGRKELAPYSDIDIMFFAMERKNTRYFEDIFYRILNTGIYISHSFRTPEDCIEEAKRDIKTRTSILDSRFIDGNHGLLEIFKNMVLNEVTRKNQKEFFAERYKESNNRYKKFGKSIYLLEPNIKESEGGLRDIHEALWLSKVALHFSGFDDFEKILSKDDFKRLHRAYDFILRLRIALHIVCGRGNDVLFHELQSKVAEMLKIKSSNKFKSTERLLRFYYLRARTTNELTDKIKNISSSIFVNLPRQFKVIKVNDVFSFTQNKIMVNRIKILKKEPHRIIEAYLLYSRTGKNFTDYLRDFIKRHLMLINEKVRRSPKAISLFIEIFKSERVYNTLKMMHDDGVLDRYLQEFGSLRFLVVHEPYHIYTVDEHTLFSIKALEELSQKSYNMKYLNNKHEDDLYSLLLRLFKDFKVKEILYMTLLFHDIGKAKGKLHSAEGYKSLKTLLDRLMLNRYQKETIEFLVRNHLLMSRFAFRKDIEEPENISSFSEIVSNEMLLNALLLITYADMTSISTEFLSNWKKNLLLELYERAIRYIRGIKENVYNYIDEIKKHFHSQYLIDNQLQKLAAGNQIEKFIESFIKQMPDRYLLSSTPAKIANEFILLDTMRRRRYAFNIGKKKDGTSEITILARDRSGLLSRIVGVLSTRRLNIISLRTFNSSEGFVIDRFQISNWDEMWWEGMEEMLDLDIRESILNNKTIKINKYTIKDRRFSSFIEVDNETSDLYTVFEAMTPDRIGLLYDMTNVFSSNKLNIIMARINTESNVAHDVFYVSDDSKKLANEDIISVINQLWEVLN